MLGHNHAVVAWSGLLSVETIARAHNLILSDFAGRVAPILGIVPSEMPLLLIGATFGALLPDIDQPNSYISNYRIAGLKVFKPAAYATHTFVRHRGPTHTLLALLIVMLITVGPSILLPLGVVPTILLPLAYYPYFGMAISFGYFSHLFADSLTRGGVPWLWPIFRNPFGFPPGRSNRFTTGSFMEQMVVVLFVVVTLYLILSLGFPWI